MSKNQKQVETEIELKEAEKKNQISEGVISKSDKKQDKKSKEKKEKKKKEKKGGFVKKSKETISELKKVTWPTFGEVVKKTGVVIVFVLIAGLFLFGVNTLLGYLVGLLV